MVILPMEIIDVKNKFGIKSRKKDFTLVPIVTIRLLYWHPFL
jgi:hypothetical protein